MFKGEKDEKANTDLSATGIFIKFQIEALLS
jgi:hypothetical protein